MSLTVVGIRPGPAGTRWLAGRISAAKGDDVMAPVTVVVPTQYLGLALRRALGRTPSINVRFAVLGKLAEMLGGQRLASAGGTPLTAVVRAALFRVAVRASAPELGGAIDQLSLVDRLASLATELRRRGRAPDTLPAEGPIPVAALTACAAFASLLDAHHLYDEVDLIHAAAESVGSGGESILADVGTVIVYLPGRLSQPEAALILALAVRADVAVAMPALEDAIVDAQTARQVAAIGASIDIATPAVKAADRQVTIVVDAPEEVRVAVRRVHAGLEIDPPIPLHRTAILYRDATTYGSLVRDTLRAAGLPYAALDGRPLSDSIVGRGLLGLMRLRGQDFSRIAVLTWLSGLPHGRGHGLSAARWDSISREAGVIRGAAAWRTHLTRLAAQLRARAEGRDVREDADPFGEFLERRAGQAEAIAAEIDRIDRLTSAPAGDSWGAYVAWAHGLRAAYLPNDPAWPPGEQEAGQFVDEIVEGLGAAGQVEPLATVETFIVALDDALSSRRRTEGRLGDGVVIGPLAAAYGMSFDSVHILGMTERGYPAAAAPDPFFAGDDPLQRREDRLADERRSYLAALSAADGGTVHLSAPTHDGDLRPAYPSPWLVEAVTGITGDAVTPSSLRQRAPDHPRIHTTASTEAGVRDAPAWLSLAERRTADQMRRWRDGRHAATSPLAQRPDIGLGRALEVLNRRRSAALTEFDGNLAAAAGSPLLIPGLARGGLSATAIEQWASCPFAFLFAKILGVAATERPEDDDGLSIAPDRRGKLVHTILERFYTSLSVDAGDGRGIAFTAADHDRMEDIAAAEFRDAEARGITGNALLWENVKSAILLDLHELLRRDERRRAEGYVPRFFEQPFGYMGDGSWPAPVLRLTDGREVELHGYVDRIDLDPSRGRALVIDYKTGRRPDEVQLGPDDALRSGTKVQLAVYAAAVRRWAAETRTPIRELESLYWYVSAKGKFDVHSLVHTPAVDASLQTVVAVIDEGIRSGAFPQVPGEVDEWRGGWSNCKYCAFDRICPTGRDAVWERKSGDPASRLHLRLRPAAVQP